VKVEDLAQTVAALTERVDAMEKRRNPVRGKVDLDLVERMQSRDGPAYAIGDIRGAVTVVGAAQYGERSAVWHIEHGIPELRATEDEIFVRVLGAIAHPARLGIVRALMHGPLSSGALAEAVSLGSAGRLYHHLGELMKAGIVLQRQRGVYEVPARNVVPFLGLLACAVDLSSSVDD
jgi:DNA-binding transcriptional ArsR family regulator